MFKVITYLLVSIIPTISLANNFYLKGGVGLNNIKTLKFSNHEFEGRIKLPNSFPLIEAGIGYKFDNGIRIESVIDYYFLFITSEISTDSDKDIFNIFGKTKADSLMFNIYKDIVTIGKFTPFVGGGIGVSYLKEFYFGYSIDHDEGILYPLDSTAKSNRKEFSYKLTIGTDIKLNDNIISEISYNYFNFGNNKRKNIGGITNIGNRTYEVHNITLGMRFEL